MSAGPKGQKRPADVIGNAILVARIATGEIEEGAPVDDGKDPAAKAPGAKGGAARAKSMTPERRAEIAKAAAAMRLPGGQGRLREMVLYVCAACRDAERFGKVKLNKILWRADFKAFAERRVPLTGRTYQKLAAVPAPLEMPLVLAERTVTLGHVEEIAAYR